MVSTPVWGANPSQCQLDTSECGLEELYAASCHKKIKVFPMTLWTEARDVWVQLEYGDGIGGEP